MLTADFALLKQRLLIGPSKKDDAQTNDILPPHATQTALNRGSFEFHEPVGVVKAHGFIISSAVSPLPRPVRASRTDGAGP
jgi:hypothetical protein